MRAASLRSRLTLQTGVVILIAALVCTISFLLFTLEEDSGDRDASLLHKARAIQRILSHTGAEKQTLRLLKTLLSAEPLPYFAQIRHPDGHLQLIASHPASASLFDSVPIASPQPIFQTHFFHDHPYRLLYFPSENGLIALAVEQESLREILEGALLLYLILAVLLLGVVLWGGRWLASRALAPIVELADASERITTLDTATRLPTGQADDEISRLSAVLNALLDRLQANFALVRRFTADAAHEIKTPLAILQGHLENALHTASNPARQEDEILLTLREVSRLHRLVEGLLLLSRSDAGRLDLQLTRLDFSALCRELLHDADILCAPLGLHLTADITPDIVVQADHSHLRQVLLNLLDNACKYNRPGGLLHLALEADESEARLLLTNTGPAIPNERIPHLFERFQRGDTSRTRTTHDGLGLGLSISREIIQAHGGHLKLVQSEKDSTTFALTLFKAIA